MSDCYSWVPNVCAGKLVISNATAIYHQTLLGQRVLLVLRIKAGQGEPSTPMLALCAPPRQIVCCDVPEQQLQVENPAKRKLTGETGQRRRGKVPRGSGEQDDATTLKYLQTMYTTLHEQAGGYNFYKDAETPLQKGGAESKLPEHLYHSLGDPREIGGPGGPGLQQLLQWEKDISTWLKELDVASLGFCEHAFFWQFDMAQFPQKAVQHTLLSEDEALKEEMKGELLAGKGKELTVDTLEKQLAATSPKYRETMKRHLTWLLKGCEGTAPGELEEKVLQDPRKIEDGVRSLREKQRRDADLECVNAQYKLPFAAFDFSTADKRRVLLLVQVAENGGLSYNEMDITDTAYYKSRVKMLQANVDTLNVCFRWFRGNGTLSKWRFEYYNHNTKSVCSGKAAPPWYILSKAYLRRYDEENNQPTSTPIDKEPGGRYIPK